MPEPRETVSLLFIDADDTLWENNVFYLRCTAKVLRELEHLGVPSAQAQAQLDRTEQRLIPALGYGPSCYLAALEALCRESIPALPPMPLAQLLDRVRGYAQQVLDPPIILLADVAETLAQLRTDSRLILVTKGADEVQLLKIERSGLRPLFDDIRIVPEKHPGTYASLVSELGGDAARTWMIGNSPRSDINPAVEAGIGAIYIPHSDTWTAELQEVRYPDRTVVLERFADLVSYFRPKAASTVERFTLAT